jgi:hypothetical protein
VNDAIGSLEWTKNSLLLPLRSLTCLLLKDYVPAFTLASVSHRPPIALPALAAIIRRWPDTVLYPEFDLDPNLTMLVWSACIAIGSPSTAPGTTADARGTTLVVLVSSCYTSTIVKLTIIDRPSSVGVAYS